MVLDKIFQMLIDLAKDRLVSQRTPRQKAARAFVRLYTALTECHEAYMLWQQTSRAIGPAYSMPEFASWRESVEELDSAFQKVRAILGLFAPDVQRRMRVYLSGELVGVDEVFVHGNKKTIERIARLLIDEGLYAP